MLKLPQKTRALLADKFADAGNLALVALTLGQALSDRFSKAVAVIGIGLWLLLLGTALWIDWED